MALDKTLTLEINNKYFEAFQNKDLVELRTLYNPSINLTDWTGEWIGIDTVLDENEAFFKNRFTLTVVSTNEFYAEGAENPIGYSNNITIEVNGETLNIIDELIFDNDYKINSIYAIQQ